MPPTTVLVHGAFAESLGWNRVIDLLPAEHRVIAAANPLRRQRGPRTGRPAPSERQDHTLAATERSAMHEIHVTVVSPEEAAYGTAEFWSGGRMIGFTRFEDGDLIFRIEPRGTAPPWWSARTASPGRSRRPTGSSPSSEPHNQRQDMKIVSSADTADRLAIVES